MKPEPMPTTLSFRADWQVAQSGPIKAGDTLFVEYAKERSLCPVPAVTMGYRTNDGRDGAARTVSMGSKPVQGTFRYLLTVPQHGTELSLWFSQSSEGCERYDSSFGRNFRFAITK